MITSLLRPRLRIVGAILDFGLTAACLTLGAGVPGTFAQEKPTPELTSEEHESTFKVQVERNLVLVRAVVRDGNGKPIPNLQKDDFRLLDNGKPQVISHFSVEIPSAKLEEQARKKTETPDSESAEDEFAEPTTAERFLAIFFDDVHILFEDLSRTQLAADHYLETALQPGDRVGIFTSSGERTLDFTDDRAKLHEALMRIRPRSIVPRRDHACPDILDYQAYQMVYQHDPFAIDIATEEAYRCYYENRGMSETEAMALARSHAEGDAVGAANSYQTETVYALRSLDTVVRRLAVMPGQRTIVLASPGFLMQTEETRVNEVIERALRSNVVINTLDAKGLYAPVPFGDASQNVSVLPRRVDLIGKKQQIQLRRMEVAAEVLRNLAFDTGGVFFHNSNDLQEGFRRVGALPELYYVLGFSPQNLKLDGRFHNLKVALNTKEKFSVQARSGYFAPAKPVDPASQAKEEIEQAVFSRDELHELPIEMQTQFFKTNDADVKLSVLTRLDLHFVQFRKEGGRNLNSLTIVAALFDRDGKYVTGKEKRLHLQLLDASLERLLRSGVTAKLSFDVHPGTYMVRQVVRDAEGAQLTAINRTIEIPY
ncbi:MAG: VWA domain-containing protein [Terriglobia bacterium]